MAEEFDPFASGRAQLVDSPRQESDSFDPFASGQAVAVEPKKEAAFDPFASGQAQAVDISDIASGAGKSLAEGAAVGGGGVLKGLAVAAATDATPSGIFNDTGRANPLSRTGSEIPYTKTASQKLEEIKRDPAYQLGDLVQKSAKEYYAKSKAEDAGKISHAINSIAETAGSFAPLIASGPLAPLTIGLQTAGESAEKIYDQRIAAGDDNEKAAKFAVDRAVSSGIAQAALFEILPKPLQKLGDKYIVDNVADGAIKKFLARRVAQASEGAVIGATSTAATNAAEGNPITDNIGTGAAGLAAIQAVMPRAKLPEVANPEQRGPSLVEQMDASTNGTPAAANVAANEIAMKPVGEIQKPPTTAELNGDEGGATLPPAKPEPEAGPAQQELLSRSGGEEALKSIKDALASDKGYVQVTVWPDEYKNKDGSRVETFDAIDPDNPQPGGNGSTNRALLTEIGQDIPKLPKDFPDGQYTLDEFKKLVKEHEKASDSTKAPSVEEKAPPVDSDKASYLDELLATKEITPEEHAAQLAELGIKRDPAVQAVTNPAFEIPKELSKSNPRYKTSEVKFEDPLDKALYIIAQDAKRSARDPDFLKLVMDHTGMDEAQARAAGQRVRDRIKTLANNAEEGQPLTLKKNAVQIKSPASLPVPAQTQNSQGVGQEIRNRVAQPAEARQAQEGPVTPEPSEAKVSAQAKYRKDTLEDIHNAINRSLDSPSVDINSKKAIELAVKHIAPGFPDTWKDATKDLPITAIEALRDKVSILSQIGREKVKIRQSVFDEEKRRISENVYGGKSAKIEDSPLSVNPGNRLGLYDRIKQSVGNKITNAVNFANRNGRALLVRDVMLDMLDGNSNYDGPLSRSFGGRIDLNYNAEHNIRNDLREPIASVLKDHDLDKTSMERISIYAISKQEGGLARLKDSGVSPETVKAVSSSLTEGEKAFYEASRKILDEDIYPKVKKFMHDNYNVDVKKVENYWPWQRDFDISEPDIVADPLRFKPGGEVGFDELATWRSLENDFKPERTTKTAQGMTIERTPEATGGVKLNAADVIERHIRQVSHLLANQRDLKLLGQIARSDKFSERYGKLGQKYVLDLLDTVSRDSAPMGSTRSAMLDWLTKNSSVAILGFRLLSQMKHLPNVAFSVKNVRPDYLTRGLIQSMTKEGKAFIEKNFAEIHQRFGGETSIQDLASGTTYGKLQALSFIPERLIDAANAQATVLGSYMQGLAESGKDPKNYNNLPIDKNAQRRALILSRQSVTSPLRKDTPQAISRGAILGNNMSLTRALFQFQNTMLRQAGYLKHDIYDLGIKELNPKQLTVAALSFIAMIAAETGIVEANRNLLGAKKKKESDDNFAEDMALEVTKRAPFVGNLVSAAKSGQTGIPILDTVVGGVHAIGQRVQNKNDFGQKFSGVQLKNNNADIGAFLGGVLGVPGASTAAQYYKNQNNKK